MVNNYNLFCKVIWNLMKMLKNRGYIIDKIEKTLKDEKNENNIKELYKCDDFKFTIQPHKEYKCYRKNIKIIVNIHEKPTPKLIKSYFKDYDITEYDDSMDHEILIIFKTQPSNSAREINKHVQYFSYTDLFVDKVDYRFVPKHELITNSDTITDIVTNKYKLKTKWNLPLIKNTDPIAKYYNAKHGDLFKITRNNNTSGTYYVYRCVV